MHHLRSLLLLGLGFLSVLIFGDALAQDDKPTDAYGEPVGFIRHELPAASDEFVSSPFLPFSARLDELLVGQLVGSNRVDASDLVQKWIPSIQDYVTAFKSAGTATTSHNDDLARDGAWATDNQKWPPETLTIAPGEALRIVNRQAVPQQLFLDGQVVLADSWPVAISPLLSLFSHPFLSQCALNEANLGTKGAASLRIADFVATIAPATDHWLGIAQGDAATGTWIDAATGRPSALVLAPGHAYWYGRAPQEGFVWSVRRPYPNPFNVAPRAPLVFAMEPGEDAMTLHIACSGDKGEVLEIFYQDLAKDEAFDPSCGWIVAAEKIATEGRTTISWTDFGGQSPVVPGMIAASVSIPRIRLYLVSRQDRDADGDHASNGRERFVLGTDPFIPDKVPDMTLDASSADDLDIDDGDRTLLGTTQKYYFVDAARSVDTGAGTTWATAKKYISSGVALAKTYLAANPTHECFVLVKTGTYSNSSDRNLNFENRAVRLVGDDGLGGDSLGGDSPVTVTGGSTVRALAMNGAGTGTLVKNFTFQNFTTNLNGTVYVVDSTVTFENCNFYNNAIATTSRDGGAMYLDGGTVILDNCTFTTNRTTRDGGAVFVTGTDLEITGCGFDNNELTYGTSGEGGAISVNGTATLHVEDSTFTDNYSTFHGGAIFFDGSGGGLTHGYASGTFDGVMTRCTFSGNEARMRGGAIYNHETLLVFDSCLTGNSCDDSGGAICHYGGDLLTILQSTLSGNSVNDDGGALYVYSSCPVDIYNSTIYGNSANRGGGIYRYGGSIGLYSTVVARNTATSSGPDIRGTIAVAQYSLVRDTTDATFSSHSNCILGASTFDMHALADNGGPTKTHAIDSASAATGSAAIDTGSNPLSLDYDQRGAPFTRTYNNYTDIGAYESPTYAVTYNANGATSGTAPANQTKFHDVNLTLRTNTGNLGKTGYTFSGWNTQADGNGTNYAAGGTYSANAAVTLYAKWTPNTYAITYNANGATSGTAPADQTKTYGVNLTLRTNTGNLAKTGYTLAGWNTLANGSGTDYALGGTYTANAAVTLYAKWTPVSLTIVKSVDPVSVPEGVTDPPTQVGIKLSAQPAGNIVIGVAWASDDDDISITVGSSLTFTTSNWNDYQQVTFAAAEDADTTNGSATFNATKTSGINPVTATTITANESENDTTLTVNDDGLGFGTTDPSGPTVVTMGEATSITATVTVPCLDSHHFVNWTVISGSATFGDANAMTTTVTISAPATIQANFAKNSYLLTYTAGANGSVDGVAQVTQTVEHGDSATPVTAIPDETYHFTGWTGDYIGMDNPLTLASVTGPMAVTATFARNTYTVTFDLDGKGTRTDGGELVQIIEHGEAATAPIVDANAGWHFTGWDVAFDNITGPITVTAQYLPTYTLTYNAGPSGAVNGVAQVVQVVVQGENGPVVTPQPNANHHFVDWSDFSTANPRQDMSVTGDIAVTATFAIDAYRVEFVTDGTEGATLGGNVVQTIDHGSYSSPVEAIPTDSYHFTGWTGDYVGTDNPLTIASVTGPMTITANFAVNEYIVAFQTDGTPGATVNDAAVFTQTLSHGSDSTPVTAAAATGYHFTGWTGDYVGMDNPLTVTSVTGPMSVTATFAVNVYTLTYTAGPNGAIIGDTPQTVAHGGNGTEVTANPNANYHFVKWSDDVMTAARTDTGVTGSISVTATFAIDEHTVVFQTDGTPATLTGTTPQVVAYGSDCTSVTANAALGYAFVRWSRGGVEYSTNPTITPTNVTENMTFVAEYDPIYHSVTFTAGANGSLSGSLSQSVLDGHDATAVTATPDEDYLLIWSGDYVGAENPLTLTNVTADMDVTANFDLDPGSLELEVSWPAENAVIR